MARELTDLVVILVHETEKAILVDHGDPEPVWIPKSIVEIEKNPDNKTWTITIPFNFAKEKGMI